MTQYFFIPCEHFEINSSCLKPSIQNVSAYSDWLYMYFQMIYHEFLHESRHDDNRHPSTSLCYVLTKCAVSKLEFYVIYVGQSWTVQISWAETFKHPNASNSGSKATAFEHWRSLTVTRWQFTRSQPLFWVLGNLSWFSITGLSVPARIYHRSRTHRAPEAHGCRDVGQTDSSSASLITSYSQTRRCPSTVKSWQMLSLFRVINSSDWSECWRKCAAPS